MLFGFKNLVGFLVKEILANNSFFALYVPQTRTTFSTFIYNKGKQILSISEIPEEPWRKGKVNEIEFLNGNLDRFEQADPQKRPQCKVEDSFTCNIWWTILPREELGELEISMYTCCHWNIHQFMCENLWFFPPISLERMMLTFLATFPSPTSLRALLRVLYLSFSMWYLIDLNNLLFFSQGL